MEESKPHIQRPFKGLVTDTHPTDQPEGTYRYALNAVNQNEEGNLNFLSSERAAMLCESFPAGTTFLASIYMVNDLTAVFLSDTEGYSYIGIVDKEGKYTNHVKTTVLELNAQYPIEGTFRVRRNSANVIYWVDGHHRPRLYNFERPFDFYSPAYIEFLKTHTLSDTYTLEKFSEIKFDLIKTYSEIPTFDNVEVLPSGNIPSGSYSVAIQLIDENLSPTEWITSSNPVMIYVDSTTLNYSKIRGSRKSNSQAQFFSNAQKSIKWTFGNLDENFSFYRVAILCANAGTGEVNEALVSELVPISDPTFVYSGNVSSYTLTPLSDIEKNKTDIDSAKYIEQLENRMILSGIKGKQVNWCSLQVSASKIKSVLAQKTESVEKMEGENSSKNPVASFTSVGYVWGEVYSFGIVYIFKDGYKSPVYHIPGRPSGISHSMDYYACTDKNYPAIHSCDGDYWGVDGYSESMAQLVDTPIRHHKFPKRNGSLYSESINQIANGTMREITINIAFPDFATNAASAIYGEITVTDSVGNVIDNVQLVSYPDQAFQEIIVGNYNPALVPVVSVVEYVAGTAPTYSFTQTYVDNAVTVPIKTMTTGVCGIKFLNIERPHPDVIGFEIVRNKREEDDKLIVDNVILGSMGYDSTSPYHSFGLLAPRVADAKKSTASCYIFSPEHQFRGKQLNFNSFDITGAYLVDGDPYLPLTTSGEAGNGLYLQDVRPGTTFNSAYHKGEDPDGFDLQVLYRSTKFIYQPVSDVTVPAPTDILYLSAAGNRSVDNKIFFNACIDNKIMVATFADGAITNSLFTYGGKARLLYGSLVKDNTECYANFINMTYYRETNNPTLFGDTEQAIESEIIFNGDSYVNPMTINASTYYDTQFGGSTGRDKKSRVWKIVLGAVIAVAAIAVNVIPGLGQALSVAIGSASIALFTAATAMAIGYGISMITSGIEFETMKNMIDDHYEAGLKITVQDTDNTDANYKDGSVPDDKFLWFTDCIQNIYFESSINIGLRSGLTASISDFINAPSIQPADSYPSTATASKEIYEVYLSNKYTVIDREQNSGRLYLGYTIAEFYDINLDYLRHNHEKPQYHLPIEYDCCSLKIEEYNNRVFYSEQSFQEEKLDNYRNFLPNNYKDIEGQMGEITGMFKFNNTLYIHTTESLLVLPQNMQERQNTDLVTFIGTGEFFAIPVRQVTDGEKGAFGSSDTRATVVTRQGVFFVNSREGIPYMLGQQPKDISQGNSTWLKQNLRVMLHDYILKAEKAARIINSKVPLYSTYMNPSVGLHAVYDALLNRIVVTKLDYIPLFTLADYSVTNVAGAGKVRYNPDTNQFLRGTLFGETEILLSNPIYFENKSFTMSFSLDSNQWISYHSYLPKAYFSTPSALYSPVGNLLFAHHAVGKFCEFYGLKYPFTIEYVSASSPVVTRTWNDVSLVATGRRYINNTKRYVNDNSIFFDRVLFYNSHQSSGEMTIVKPETTENYLLSSIQNVQGQIKASKKENIWHLNHLRDHVVDYTQPLFLDNWDSLKTIYPIDKVVNQAVINLGKSWYELESFRDNYLIIRFTLSRFDATDTQLTVNYSIENEQPSLR